MKSNLIDEEELIAADPAQKLIYIYLTKHLDEWPYH